MPREKVLLMLGECALCRVQAELQKSHLIPKWAYKRALGYGSIESSAPIHISGGNALLTNKQTTQRLLCRNCEQRFSVWENSISELTKPEDGSIKLFKNIVRADTPKKVLARLENAVDSLQISYFAASVLWRACVMTGECRLGPYEEGFREYLLGRTTSIPGVVISVGVFEKSLHYDARGWVSEPTSTKASIGWLHGFLICGLVVRCWIGKSIPKEWQMVSLSEPNSDKYVWLVRPEDCVDFLAAAEMVETAVPRGKLADI